MKATSGAILAVVLLTCWSDAARAQGAPTLVITSPSNGVIVAPGQTINVDVSASNLPTLATEDVTGWTAVGSTPPQPAANNLRFNLFVPSDTPVGSYQLTAILSSTGGMVTSQPVTVVIPQTTVFSALNINLPYISMYEIGEQSKIILGGVANGVSQILDGKGLTYSSSNPSVATVDSYGTVTAVSNGTAQITCTYQAITSIGQPALTTIAQVSVAISAAATAATMALADSPKFSPAGGTYNAAQGVTLSSISFGSTIYYTTDGTTPTANSPVYSGPIPVDSSATIKAFAGGTGYTNSAVASATYIINLPQDFTFGLSASSLTVTAGQSGTLTASIGPVNGFNQAVSFTCSGLPAGAACSFSPTTVTPNGTGSATTTVTITTAARAGLLTGHRPFELAGLIAGLSLWFAGRRFRKLRRMGVLSVVMVGIGSIVSCGKSPAPQEPTTSTLSINAASGSLTHASTFSLTVQ